MDIARLFIVGFVIILALTGGYLFYRGVKMMKSGENVVSAKTLLTFSLVAFFIIGIILIVFIFLEYLI